MPGSGALGRGPAREGWCWGVGRQGVGLRWHEPARQVRVVSRSVAPKHEPARQVRVVPDTELISMEC